MSQDPDSAVQLPIPVRDAVQLRKSHRIQVRIPPQEISQTVAAAGLDKPVRASIQTNLCDSQQVGILRGSTAYTKPYKSRENFLKHLAVVYLYTILKAPPKWTPETFNEIVELEAVIATRKLEVQLPIPRNDKLYNIHLSNSFVRGCFVTPGGRSSRSSLKYPDIHEALARIRRGSGVIWKCDSHHFLIRRLPIGWYFYTTNLQDRPALMFFSCPQLMVNLVRDTYGCTDRSKYILSSVVLHSVEEDDMVRIAWKMKRTVGMKLISPLESVLHGNVCLVKPSLQRSLEIGLSVLARSGKPLLWDNKVLNGCFRRTSTHFKVADKMAAFFRDRNETNFSIGQYELPCRTAPITHRQRKHFEEVINYFLASCSAILVVGLDCCFPLWVLDDFIYWFSPYRFSTLHERPEVIQNRASFLRMTNALAKASHSLFEYLYELGVFPDHSIEVLPLQVDKRRANAPIPDVDEESLDDEDLTIPPSSEKGWTSFYSPEQHTPSELRLARQMVDMVYRSAEDRCG